MRYATLLDLVGDDPVFETSLLAAGDTSPYQAQRRLADWTRAGKVIPLRRGLFVLPKDQRSVEPHHFVIANRLVPGSYVSLEMVLSYYSLIPEGAVVTTSVTTGRPQRRQNEFGRFLYRHIHPRYFFGLEHRLVADGQHAYIAHPEKALLDFLYLRKDGGSAEFIQSLRLQNLEQLDLERLEEYAVRFHKSKLHRALPVISHLAATEAAEYVLM